MIQARRLGRPPLPRGIIDIQQIDWGFPESIVLDTSSIVEFLIPGSRSHSEWKSFFSKTEQAQTVLIVNRLVLIELKDVAFNHGLQQRLGKRGAHGPGRHDGRSRRAASRSLDDVWSRWEWFVENAELTILEI